MDTTVHSALALDVARLSMEDPAWLAAARQQALIAYDTAGLPVRSQHLWRYTDPAKLLPDGRQVQPAADRFGELPADYHDGTFEHVAALALERDGRLLRTAVDPHLADAGLVVADLRTAAKEHEDVVRGRLFGLTNPAVEKFEALSMALFSGGPFIHVPRGKVINRPIRVAHRVGGDGLVAGRSLVVIEEGAEATIVFDLSTATPDDAPLFHTGTEVYVEAGARLRLVTIQAAGSKLVHAPIVRCRVGRDASFETVSVVLGGALVKAQQTTELVGKGASAKVLGVVFAEGRQHLDHNTLQDHVAAHTSSDLDYRTVVADRARSAYTGNLRIGLDGVGANAHQRNHNLLLSDRARADTIPELEILTNDVTCSHAAAVGPLDPELIHFCMSRGLSPSDARKLIISGFLEPVLARIPGDDLQQRVREALASRLEAVA